MEVTEKMYFLAKEIVKEYEKNIDINEMEIIDPFQISLLDQIEDIDTIEMINGCKIKIDSDSKFNNYFEESTEIHTDMVDSLMQVSKRFSPKLTLDIGKGKDKSVTSVIEKTFNKDVLNCYRVCLDYFPTHLHPKKESIVKSWYSTIDKLNRIDKVPFSEIERITKLAREDEFTSKNIFHSLTKLRKKPKGEDIYWIVKWSEKFKPKTKTVNRQSEETIKKNIDGW
jgi:hypothetical protein